MEKQDRNIERLKERFKFTNSDLALLNEIKNCEISSIASTVEGGFEKNTGNFNPNGNANLFKVCIRYQERDSNSVKVLCLVKSSESLGV